MYTAHISIGSNLGDRLQNCTEALQALHEHKDIDVVKVSGWYESLSETQDGEVRTGDPSYVNGAAAIETELPPEKLLKVLLDVESRLGRPRKRKKGTPRVIDLDLLLYEGEVKKEKDIIVPHPSISKRLFVLKPLYDIAPEAVEPVSGRTVTDLMNECLTKDTANFPTRLDELTEDAGWE